MAGDKNLRGANLQGADLSGVNLSRTDLSEANLIGANLSRANLSYANLDETNLSKAKLISANLHGAIFLETRMMDADLQDADLTGSNLYSLNLHRANLKGVRITPKNVYPQNAKKGDRIVSVYPREGFVQRFVFFGYADGVEGDVGIRLDPAKPPYGYGTLGGADRAIQAWVEGRPVRAKTNPRPARANRTNWRGATQVQTLLFDKALFTPTQARRWAKKHNFEVPGIDQGSDASQYHRVRQHDPEAFRKGTMRTIEFTDGIKAVIGVPIGAPPKQR